MCGNPHCLANKHCEEWASSANCLIDSWMDAWLLTVSILSFGGFVQSVSDMNILIVANNFKYQATEVLGLGTQWPTSEPKMKYKFH